MDNWNVDSFGDQVDYLRDHPKADGVFWAFCHVAGAFMDYVNMAEGGQDRWKMVERDLTPVSPEDRTPAYRLLKHTHDLVGALLEEIEVQGIDRGQVFNT